MVLFVEQELPMAEMIEAIMVTVPKTMALTPL